MVDKISQDSPVDVDAEFTTKVIDTLNKTLDDIDELSLQRLKKARIRALGSVKPSGKWTAINVAASLIILLSVPFLMHKYLQDNDQDFDVVSQDVPYSTEEMDDIDMLMSLEYLEDSDA